ncbi:MAG: glutamine amidotransferase [Planctomycetaceae bacterium]
MNAYLTFDDSLAWLAVTAGLLLLCALVLGRAYRRKRAADEAAHPAPPRSALALKAIVFAFLVLCLLDPLWSGMRATPGANRLVFLVDDSRSMTIADEANGDTRGDVAARLLDHQRSPWLVELDRQFDVRTDAFGSRPRSLDGGDSLAFAEDQSNLAKALASLRTRLAGSPVAGIVLLTDGNATDLAIDAATLAALDLSDLPPIHPVALGGRASLPDLAVRHVGVTRSAFEDAPVTIRAEVAARGLAGRNINVELVDESNTVTRSETRTIDGERETVAIEFRIGHAGDRPRFHRVRASVQLMENGEPFAEATLANNVRTVVVERTKGPHRILYLAGRPNWEFKFLNRAVAEDDELDLVALVRIARQAPKLQWRGRDGGSGNRLFRNFDDTPESERERADEPVLVRLNTRDANELAQGFPTEAEELFAFDAVILDDLEASFFSYDQLALLRRFVAERGGSLLMLGGPQTFTGGGWDRTALAEVLPVNLGRRESSESSGIEPQRLALTREGLLQPWVRLRATADEERTRLAEMPGFRVVSAIGAVRPGATALAETVDEAGRRFSALVVHRYGHGRGAALTLGDLWRWQLRREGENDHDDLGRMWRQTLRWLAADVPERVRVELADGAVGRTASPSAPGSDVRFGDSFGTGAREPSVEASRPGGHGDSLAGRIANPSYGSVSIRVHVRDAEHRPLDGGTVRVTIEPPSGEPLELLAEPSLARPGMYEIEYVPRVAGAYRVRAVANDGDGEEIGADESGWAREPDATEFARIEPDRELLRELAKRTGGRLLSPEELPAFARGLPMTDVPVTERVATPLWHRSWLFLLVLGCLAGEWGLRRRRGLR